MRSRTTAAKWDDQICSLCLTGRDCTIKQLKNHWDIMKTDWKLFTKLKCGYTKLEWDEFTKTIDASDLWWDEHIQENPKLKKLKKLKGKELLKNWFSYVTLFSDTSVTGGRARDQHSSVGSDSMCDEILCSTLYKESTKESCGDNYEDL
ncbi:hypothetical protein POM88_041853 [Heracleum sosnowskyi]|uniref:Myb/SANT-like domain-containing protein n=1 Tax=Heracleum sosnowskyi TaxID=360622 RepID=A0AAD8HF75_9APIA|nr:hypothetical protein POM88_041853 [Heracleum sosnowskyi]